MDCSSCGHSNLADARFCDQCGADFPPACPNCGATNQAGARFCRQCRTPLQPSESPSSRSLEPQASSQPPPSSRQQLPSSFAAGRYNVRAFLGEGAKKRVYLAHDAKLDRDVAFALIKTDGLDADGIVRVRREAQAMGRLGDHPHIVTIFDTGDEQAGPYIVSQYRGGGSVEDVLVQAEGHRIASEPAMRIVEQICHALQHAHGRGIVHRDLKPGNVWLDEDGNAALGDFGLAVVLDRSRMTMQGMMVGTVAYMAPEQALGRTPDARSDLYALGAMLYEMVTGRPPFLGDDAVGVISQHINTSPVAPSWHEPSVPKPLEALVLRLLAKSPGDRPASAQEVAAELRRILERSTVEPPPSTVQPDTVRDLRGLNWGFFVGRREEMDGLKDALEDALSGKGSLAMLVGEPGIGKTRLAEEFGVYAGLRGAQVLTGHCYEGEASLPYRSFVEAFRQYTRSRPDDELRTQLGPGAPEIATLVSEIRQRFPDIEEAPKLDPEAERLRLFESVTEFLHNASMAQPLVLHFDDLHWADKPSLLLLQHLAQRTARDRLLVIGAYRDVELDRTHPLSETLGALRRLPNYRRVLLRGLPQETITDLLTVIDPSEEGEAGRQALSAALYQETEGNPFFIREVLAHLIETGKIAHENGRWVGKVTSVSELGIPEGVREVIGRRLSRLTDGCNRMLTLASTMTGGFSWEALKAINTDTPESQLLDLLEEALAAQLIAERKGDLAGTYDFTHALIRQTLYDELSTPRRVLLHRQIGEALEGLYANNVDAHLPELAHHFYQAAPGGDVEKAIDYARRAGDRATSQLAYEEAASHYERALQTAELGTPISAVSRLALLRGMAQAYFRADLSEHSIPAAERAVRLAEDIGDPALFAATAIDYANAIGRSAFALSEISVAELQRALVMLPEDEIALRSLVLARLTVAQVSLTPDERLAMARETLELAQRAGDDSVHAQALGAMHFALAAPEQTEERLAITEEWYRAAARAGESSAMLFSSLFKVTCLAELGDMAEVRQMLPVIWDMADQMREPAYSGWRPIWSGMLATMEGRYAEAETLAVQALPIAQRTQHPNFIGSVAGLFYDLRRGQGRLAELETIVLQLQRENPAVQTWQAALSFLYADTGRLAEAREWFDRLAANQFTDLPRDFLYMTVLVLASELARRLGDAPRAALLYDMLFPFAKRNIVVGNAVLILGSASRPLGQLAATLGRWDDAERHFEYALAFDEKIDAAPWLARTRSEYASMLRERDAPGDRARAVDLLVRALATFDELGMKKELERGLALKLQLQGVQSGDIYTSIDNVARAVEHERPEISIHPAPDGTVTIMFSDIEDSTVLTERLGDQAWQELLREHNALIRGQIRAHGGYEVKTMGDGFMVAFQSAKKGLDCAIAIQRAFDQHNAADGEHVKVRIGLHAGEAIKDGDDFYGKNVIMASRVAGRATGSEILISSLVRQLVESSVAATTFSEPRATELKGLAGMHTLFAVDWSAQH